MSLTLSLNTALSGLKVNRESLSVLSQNIANANNPDYSRKIITQSAVELNGVGVGVQIEDIDRKVDSFLQTAIRSHTSIAGKDEVLSDYADRLQLLLGDPGESTGINSYITNMFNAMQALAETPERSSNRVNVVNAAQSLIDELDLLSDGIQELRFDADQEIKTSVTKVNLLLTELYDLNTAISNASVLNRPISELLDQRDAAIRDIAEHMDVNIFVRENETVNIYAKGGASLLDTSLYQLEYSPISSPDSLLLEDPLFSALSTYLVDPDSGARIDDGLDIVTAGTIATSTTSMTEGRIKGLLDIRNDTMADVLDQIDMLAASLRDEVNAVHNAGSGYPGLATMTGTRPVTPEGATNWTGSVRIGLVDIDGQPLPSVFSDETSPMRPLTIDLSTLDSGLGQGPGYVDPQTLVNEINSYYGIPRNRLSLGDINNIQLTSTTTALPTNYLNFDFDLENISGSDAEFFVTSVSVLDDTATDITSVTDTAPSITLDAANTYTTTMNSSAVTIAATGHGLATGDYVFMPTPSSAVGGISAANLGGMFQVTVIDSNTFQITAATAATSAATLGETGTARSTYYDSVTGTKDRTTAAGSFSADLIGNISSSYYDVNVGVSVVNADGTIESSVITYRVTSEDGNMYNKRYGATSATGAGEITTPTQRTQPYARAKLVDADGNELAKINGRYITGLEGYLQLEVNDSSYYLSIDSLDSVENGDPNGTPFVVPGTDRGFSHYFELNNFFASNNPTSTGDTLLHSARNLELASHIVNDPANVSTGTLVLSPQSADPDAAPIYSYERISGDDSIIQQLADLSSALVSFDSAGGLSAVTQTLSGYAGEILGFAGSEAISAESNYESSQIILDGFVERSTAISGVNIDEELANTIIYQNAYSASARIITVTDELFETLINSF